MVRHGGTRRRRREDGKGLLDVALVLIPLLAFFLGIIDISFGIFLRNTMQHAVREGVRYAVTYRTSPGLGHDASIRSIVLQNSMGFISPANASGFIKIRYYQPDTLAETAANAPGNIVEVSVEDYTWGWMAPLLRSPEPLRITARSSDRMESLPGGTAAPPR
ncbi:MAG: pilus assembly protein [Acidobacteria bacterium]|nr:pilus assembly protein [Acidobacteriota bacterium]